MSQAVLAIQCISLQNIGFSAKEISDIMSHSSQLDLPGMIHGKMEELEEKMKFYEEMLCQLEDAYPMTESDPESFSEAADAPSPVLSDHESWSVAEAEPFYSMENSRNGIFYGTDAHAEIARDWNRFMPITQIFSRIEFDTPKPELSHATTWNMGLKISAPSADRFQILKNEYVHLIRPGKCLIYQFSGLRPRDSGNDALSNMLQAPLALCRKHHLQMKGEVYIFNIFGSTMEPKNYVRETVLIPIL
jgi:hypothetical protein